MAWGGRNWPAGREEGISREAVNETKKTIHESRETSSRNNSSRLVWCDFVDRPFRIFPFNPKGANLPGLIDGLREVLMSRDSATTDRLRNLIAKLQSLTKGGALHWEKQDGSAHRYARWTNNLVILGPATPLS